MKRNIFLIAALLLIFFAAVSFAQTALTFERFEGKALLLQFPSTTIDSVTTVYSTHFDLAGYDYDGFSTTANQIQTTWKLASVTGLPKILTTIQGNNDLGDDSGWTVIDTLSAARDSVETQQKGTITLNLKKYAYYRFAIAGLGTAAGSIPNRRDTTCKLEIYIPKRRQSN
jgi:hypothetical protein